MGRPAPAAGPWLAVSFPARPVLGTKLACLPCPPAAMASGRARLPRHLRPRGPAFPAMVSRNKCAAAAASDSGDLPLDALREILLRLSAKELCRLRVVSPSWRSLTFDPTFIAAHRARHPDALLTFAYDGDDNAHGVSIVDLSGELVRRMPSDQDGLFVLRNRLDLVCVACRNNQMALWVLNPATGAALALPECHSEYTGDGQDQRFDYGYGSVDLYAFGRVSSGEYKALRISSGRTDRICEVITIDTNGRNHGVWRETHAPPSHICRGDGISSMRSMMKDEMKYVAVGGVVHFLIDFMDLNSIGGRRMTVEPASIASFNLETEKWMPTLRGPAPVRSFVLDSNREYSYMEFDMQLSLAEMQGCLVTVHNIHNTALDLWFLSDFDKGLWVKKHSLPSKVAGINVYPLEVLDDGRIVFMRGKAFDFLMCFDRTTGIYTYDLKSGDNSHVMDLEMGSSHSGLIGIYTGSLLS